MTNQSSYFRSEVANFERALLSTALDQHHWNRRATAKFLGLGYRTLLYKIEAHCLFSPTERAKIERNAVKFGILPAP